MHHHLLTLLYVSIRYPYLLRNLIRSRSTLATISFLEIIVQLVHNEDITRESKQIENITFQFISSRYSIHFTFLLLTSDMTAMVCTIPQTYVDNPNVISITYEEYPMNTIHSNVLGLKELSPLFCVYIAMTHFCHPICFVGSKTLVGTISFSLFTHLIGKLYSLVVHNCKVLQFIQLMQSVHVQATDHPLHSTEE